MAARTVTAIYPGREEDGAYDHHHQDSWVNLQTASSAFPVRLHAMLADVAQDPNLSAMVRWRPHGRLFMVEDRAGFMKHILPRWFTMSTFASFQRQLNMYGFKTMSTGPDKGGYYHELFLRSRLELATRIPRQKYKGTGPRKPASSEGEPNFYDMPHLARAPRPSMARTASRPSSSGHATGWSLQGMLVDGMRHQAPAGLMVVNPLLVAHPLVAQPNVRAYYSANTTVQEVADILPSSARLSEWQPRPVSSPILLCPSSLQVPLPQQQPHQAPSCKPWDVSVLEDIWDVFGSDNEEENASDDAEVVSVSEDDFEPIPFRN